MKPSVTSLVSQRSDSPLWGVGGLAFQWLATTLFLMFVLENEVVARAFLSEQGWSYWLTALGGTFRRTAEGVLAIASLGGIGAASLALTCLTCIPAALLERRAQRHDAIPSGAKSQRPLKGGKVVPTHSNFQSILFDKGAANGWWSLPIAAWSLGWIISLIFPGSGLAVLLVQTVKLAAAATIAGWIWEIARGILHRREAAADLSPRTSRWIVLSAMAVYTVIFTGMNWGLWFNLQLPHGDSSMYEEHLWNFLHGKGFRSYLDQGLFLGEHIQVVHLLLVPLYVIWPSHLLLELSESAVLALGALPLLSIARRHGQSQTAATFLALAYLFYFPMHYLDIAIDLKTFRPSAFGIPALLFMIDTAERRRWGWMAVSVLVALSCQEDFGIAVGSYGVWMLGESCLEWLQTKKVSDRQRLTVAITLTVLGPLYTVLAVKYAIPWFRSGVTVHYASYFKAFGKTPVEIVINILTNPLLLWRNLVTVASTALFLDLLLPLGMPYRGWRQLLIGVPLFILLCLNELTHDFPGPFHHFHAPLIPFLVWGAACSLIQFGKGGETSPLVVKERGLWILCCAVTMTVFFSLSPVGIQFWDSGSPFYWKRLYVAGERASEFQKVLAAIPPTARVASTDFVHPRFTHYERSYDYSHYPRRVANYEDKVPDDTDYIVIDTGHRYSEIQRFEQMREYQHQRDQWEIVPIDTKGYFIVLKRVKYPEPVPAK